MASNLPQPSRLTNSISTTIKEVSSPCSDSLQLKVITVPNNSGGTTPPEIPQEKIGLKNIVVTEHEDRTSSTESNTYPSPLQKRRRKLFMEGAECSMPKMVWKPSDMWKPPYDKMFLEVCAALKPQNGMWSGNGWTNKGWQQLVDNWRVASGRDYSLDQISGKFKRLRIEFTTMNWLMTQNTGVGWDSASQTITAEDYKWDAMIKIKKDAARFRNGGVPDYTLMKEIFYNSVATGTFARSSRQDPPTDAEEVTLNMVNDNVTQEVPFPEVLVTPTASKYTSSGSKRKGRSVGSDCNSPMEENLSNVLNQWMQMESLRVEELKSKAEAKRARCNQTTEISVPACIHILNDEFSYLSDEDYEKMANSFKDDVHWMGTWIAMPAKRRPWFVHNKITMTPAPKYNQQAKPPSAGPDIDDLTTP